MPVAPVYMTKVEFDKYNFRIEEREGRQFIFDEVRKKMVTLTPEEWVRQHIIHYLLHTKGYPPGLIAVERGITINGLQKRFDVVVYNNAGEAKMVVECKAPEEPLNEKVMMQLAAYNLYLHGACWWVTNGSYNFCYRLGVTIKALENIPSYNELLGFV